MMSCLSACTSDKDTDEDPIEDTDVNQLVDADGDGYFEDEDCSDSSAAIHPGAVEICDGLDNNCDGEIDEDVSQTYYADTDEDGFGDESVTTEACSSPSGYVTNGNDCDDGNAAAYPGALEYCDGFDNDCDGDVDEDSTFTWYADADADGFGDAENSVVDCAAPTGYVADDTDCDDSAPQAWPGNEEVCDEIDNDCDDEVDEAVTLTWYQDVDADDYGDNSYTQEACTEPVGYSGNPGDCDDSDDTVNPAADEICDGQDNDCDGFTDEEDAIDLLTWYQDTDGDGYGDPLVSDESCEAPPGFVSLATDCDTSDPEQYPGADEYCNGEDDDCDSDIDEDDSVDVLTWYSDDDGDGYGDPLSFTNSCEQPSGYLSDDSDCDDGDDDSYPGADEYCNGEDDDCDGTIDENDAIDVLTWYQDSDGDGEGDPASSMVECEQPSGYVDNADDCDDTSSLDWPLDSYEDGTGYGDTCADPIDDWAVLDDSGSTVIVIEGRLHDSSDEDWYVITTSQSVTTSGSNLFDFQIDMVAGTDDYTFVVYKGSCSELQCDDGGSEGDGYTEYDYYPEDIGDGSHSPPADTTYCESGGEYNDCDDLSDTFYIKVFRTSYSSDDCATFELEITNG
jgi:hypothetical protein